MEREIAEDTLNCPFEKNTFGQTALHHLVRISEFELIRDIIRKGADINKLDDFDNTPLSLACVEKPDKIIVDLLLEAGAYIHFERNFHMDLFLECVLHCTSPEQLEIIHILLENGINVNITDKIWNRNCMHFVAITGYTPLASILLSHGAILDIKDRSNLTPSALAYRNENFEIIDLFSFYLDSNK